VQGTKRQVEGVDEGMRVQRIFQFAGRVRHEMYAVTSRAILDFVVRMTDDRTTAGV